MKSFANYRARILGDMYEGEPFGPNELTMLWPILVGCAIFAAIDIGMGISNPYRIMTLAVLLTPGTIWLGYLAFHMLRALQLWAARRDLSD
jgi:hypothetical protein